MLVHIVCWKYKDDITEARRDEHRSMLRGLAVKISDVEFLDVGADILHLDRSFDTSLIAHFADEAALQRYTDHADHQTVVAVGREIAERTISVDYLN